MANGISRLGRYRWVLGIVALTAGVPGCVAHARGELVYDYPVTYVETVPARIEYYPSTYYRGRPAYLVDGRWYYRNRDRWVVFREEPVELREYRVRRGPAYVASPRRHGYSEPNRVYAEPRSRRDGRRYMEERHVEERRAAERRAEARHLSERRAAERRAEERRDAAREAEARRDAARAAEARREGRRYRDADRADAERRSAEPRSNERRRDRRREDDRDDNERRRYQRE